MGISELRRACLKTTSALREPLGAGGADVVLPDHVEHAGAHVTRDTGQRRVAEQHHRRHRARPRRATWTASASSSSPARRDPLHRDQVQVLAAAEEEDGDRPHPERRHRVEDEEHDGADAIAGASPAAPRSSLPAAARGGRRRQRQRGEAQGHRQALPDLLGHRLPGAPGGAEVERHHLAEPAARTAPASARPGSSPCGSARSPRRVTPPARRSPPIASCTGSPGARWMMTKVMKVIPSSVGIISSSRLAR